MQLNAGGGQIEQSRPGKERLFTALILFFACFFSSSLTCQRCFHALFFARFQVEGVAFHFLNDVFLLNLAFEAAQSVFEGFSLLQPHFCQTYTPPDSSGWTQIVMTRF
jgi:hypothetical protein